MFIQHALVTDKHRLIPTEARQSRPRNRFFTIKNIKVMGDIIQRQDESLLDIVGDYVRNPAAIVKALQSSQEPALFYGTKGKWCAYVSGRYVTSNYKHVEINGLAQYLKENADDWELQKEFWSNLPTRSSDSLIALLITTRSAEIMRLTDNIRTAEETNARLEEEELRREADSAQLDRIEDETIKEQIIWAVETVELQGQAPIGFFVDHYLTNPHKLDEFSVNDLLEHPEYWTIVWPYVPTFTTLSEEEIHDMGQLTSLSTKEIMSQGKISGKEGKDGLTFIVTANSGAQYAVKTYHSDRSVRMIEMEAYLQEKAATEGVCPKIYGINRKEKYIIMEKMKETIVDYVDNIGEDGKRVTVLLSDDNQDRLIEIMYGLDRAGVIHNDGNPLNFMLNMHDQLMVIDFGFSSLIDKAMLKKRGPHPNINLTLWDVNRQLGHYRIESHKLKQTVDDYMKAWKEANRQ